ncbi:hypothetical protein K402DRAFT_402604 [Aulographum hederae CBS 113979]|uniref:Uncharacterized protein n=1 Tax=Aulographum hederae CBS 113979 TaxID=1176131 RepID=A0A6G1H6R9_9PEZI|nr:hypothetical protein K402DRAFT_402604 [Aulographum hederae CBS 113979]
MSSSPTSSKFYHTITVVPSWVLSASQSASKAKSKQRSDSMSPDREKPAPAPMASSPNLEPNTSRHHHRSLSFPPHYQSLPISPSTDRKSFKNVQQALPDIDEDPMAHFLSPVSEEDDTSSFDDEAMSFSAGILPSSTDSTSSRVEEFKENMAQKWAKYVARHHILLHALYHAPVHKPKEWNTGYFNNAILEEDEDDISPIDSANIPRIIITAPSPKSENFPRGQTSDSKRRHKRPSQTLSGRRHTWQEPSANLFTVWEAPCENETQVVDDEKDTDTHVTAGDYFDSRPQRRRSARETDV